jgi:hypothetical protein
VAGTVYSLTKDPLIGACRSSHETRECNNHVKGCKPQRSRIDIYSVTTDSTSDIASNTSKVEGRVLPKR